METEELTINFESGTTQEEMAAFAETIRERLRGKVKEEDIENIVSEYLSNLKDVKLVCDSCKNEIVKQNGDCNYTFSCKKCDLKYDLCDSCQQDDDLCLCPLGFGCNKDNGDIFITKPNKEKSEPYRIFDNQYFATHGEHIQMDFSEFWNEMQTCQHFEMSVIHIKQKNVPYEFIRDLWFHFRTVDSDCLQKYGQPKTRLDSLPSISMYKVYEGVVETFKLFISCDRDDSPLILSLIYPNSDIFFIRKLPEDLKKQGVPFGTFFIPFSKAVKEGTMESKYKLGESLKTDLEKRTNSTIENLSKEGEILQVAVGFVPKKREDGENEEVE